MIYEWRSSGAMRTFSSLEEVVCLAREPPGLASSVSTAKIVSGTSRTGNVLHSTTFPRTTEAPSP